MPPINIDINPTNVSLKISKIIKHQHINISGTHIAGIDIIAIIFRNFLLLYCR